jgi:uncharacterized Zn finger protein (UPF0148 family)
MAGTIGEYLLRGWRMLENTCPNDECYAPVLQNKQGEKWCVVCNVMIKTQEEVEREGLILTEHKVDAREEQYDEDDYEWTPPTEEEMRIYEEKAAKRDQVSKLLAEKMLCGWAMLGSYCEKDFCSEVGVPMMRDRQGELHCVLCDANGSNTVTIREEPNVEAIEVERVKPGVSPVEDRPIEAEVRQSVSHGTKLADSIQRKLDQYAELLDQTDVREFDRVRNIAQSIKELNDALVGITLS